jgi:hypothetical protein
MTYRIIFPVTRYRRIGRYDEVGRSGESHIVDDFLPRTAPVRMTDRVLCCN